MHTRVETTDKGPVHIVLPDDHDPREGVIIYLHGWNLGKKKGDWYVDQVWEEFGLERKLELSGSKAALVAIATQDGKGRPRYWESLEELLELVTCHLPPSWRTDYWVHVIGHSGAWANSVAWLESDQLNHLTLLDAIYGGANHFRDWSLQPGRYLDIGVNHGSGTHKKAWQIIKEHPSYHVWGVMPDLDAKLETCGMVYMPIKLGHMEWVNKDDPFALFAKRSAAIRSGMEGR